MEGEVRIPFLNYRGNSKDEGYFEMIKNRFFPNFKVVSMTSVLIAINLLAFIITRILYKPASYEQFLAWPSEMDKWLLDIELIKSNRSYFYQAVTAMFMHLNYLHIIGNTIFAIFIMYELEYSWMPTIPLGLFAGFAANCLAIISLEGRYVGFSGVLCSYLGMFLGLILTHCSYLRNRYQGFFCMLVVMVVFISVMTIGFGQSALVHLYGYFFGLLLGAAFFPKHPESNVSDLVNKVLKIVAVGLIVTTIVVAIAV